MTINHKLNAARALALTGACLLAHASTAGTVSVVPGSGSFGVGESFTLFVVGSGFTDGESLMGGEFGLRYDASILELGSVAIDNHWDFMPDTGAPDGAGIWTDIGFDAFANEPATGDDIAIASIRVTAVMAGEANVELLESSVFFNADSELSPKLDGASISISEVPLPAAAWLFGSALAGLALTSGRRRRRA